MLYLTMALLGACTSSGDDTAPVDTQPTDTDTDTDSTDPTPVWENQHIETSATFNGLYASGSGVYVAGTAGVLLASQSDGTWADVAPPVDGTDFGDLWGEGAGSTLVLVAGAGDGKIGWLAGGSWNVDDVGTAATEGVGGSSSTSLFAVSWGGAYFNTGADWSYEAVPGSAKLNDVYAIGGDAVAVGEGGVAAVRTGGAWQSSVTGTTADLAGITGSSTTDIWAVGAGGVALHFDGTTWTPTDTGTTQNLWAVWAATPSAVYAVGNGGVALRWDGSAWVSLATGVDNNLYAVHGSDAANVFAAGNRGALIHYTGG